MMLLTNSKLKKIYGDLEGMMRFEQFHELYKQARKVKRGVIIEVGSYRGLSTVALSMGARKGVKVYAIEPHEEFKGVLGGNFGPKDRGEFYKTMLKTEAYKNVWLVNLSSEQVTPGWKEKVDLIFIDGDHSYEGVKRDYDCWRPHLAKDAVIVFDDTKQKNIGPKKLLAELLENNQVKLLKTVGKASVVKQLS